MSIWNNENDIRRQNPEMVEPGQLTELELGLILSLSRQLHWSWGVARLRRGFTFGDERTEETHPNLRQELSDEEKQRDLEDAKTLLQVLSGMGYTVVRKAGPNVD